MAKITVYRGRPFLTMFSWLGAGCVLSGVSSLLGKAFLSAFVGVVAGIAIMTFCDSKAEGRKTRYSAGFVAILILVYQALQLLEWSFMGKLEQFFNFPELLLAVAVAAVLFAKPVKNKPLAAAVGCFVWQVLELGSGLGAMDALRNDPYGLGYFIIATMCLPAVVGVILLLRGRKMSEAERQIYVF